MGFKFKHLVFVTVVVTAVLQIGEIYLSKKLTPASRTMREALADPGHRCTVRCTSPSTETTTTTKPGYWTLTPTSHRSSPPTTTSTITTPPTTTRQTDTTKATPQTTTRQTDTTKATPQTTTRQTDTTKATPPTTTRQTDTTKATTTMAEVSTTAIPPETTSKKPTTWYPTTVTEAPTTTTVTASPPETTSKRPTTWYPTTVTEALITTTVTASPPETTSKRLTTWYPTTVTEPLTMTMATTTASPRTMGGDSTTSPHVYQDCRAAYNDGKTESGVYRISPDGDTEINVYCEQDLDGGGWAVFQHRVDGTVQFNRAWANYKRGFGSIHSEYWLGNDLIHLMTMNHNQQLKVEIEHGGLTAYANYSEFWIEDKKSFYRLKIGSFSHGNINPGNSLAYNNRQHFSTYDSDHDSWRSGNCAASHGSGWWYGYCSNADLNAVYSTSNYKWKHWSGHAYLLTASRMMMKTK